MSESKKELAIRRKRIEAAAPELLEACEAAELVYRDIGDTDRALTLIRAAIAKATEGE